MTNEVNKIYEETNLQKIGNLIKIPYYDLLEEQKHHTPFFINGFSVTEIDETNEDLYQEEDISYIETKEDFLLKKKAESIENYYMNCTEEEVSKVHCSQCKMNCFSKNELLYFKDRKALISYLKYCFIFLKKNIFMNHTIYMNNRYDLLKIDNSYLIGFHFLIPKTICKSCFIQLINKEFLLSKLKNEISDYDEDIHISINSPKKNINLLKKKKKRKEIKNSDKKEKKEKKINIINTIEKESSLQSIQISPIVIPLSNNDTPIKKAKKRRIIKYGIKRRKKRNIKKNNKKLNENVIFDLENNTIIINKKILNNLELKEKEKKEEININKTENKNEVKKIIKNKEKKLKEKKQIEMNKIEDNNNPLKNININKEKKETISNKNKEGIKKEKNIINKNIIINNTNEIKTIDMNKIGLIQINNNNNTISNNKQNIIIPMNQFNFSNYYLNKLNISNDLEEICNILKCSIKLCTKMYNYMTENSMKDFDPLLQYIYYIIKLFENIDSKIEENRILMEYSFLMIKKNINNYQQFIRNKEVKLNIELSVLYQIAIDLQKNYKFIYRLCFEGWNILRNQIEKVNLIKTAKNRQNK